MLRLLLVTSRQQLRPLAPRRFAPGSSLEWDGRGLSSFLGRYQNWYVGLVDGDHDPPLACDLSVRQRRGGTVNVVSYNGGKVHSSMPGQEERPYPLCRGGGMNQNLTKFRATDAPLTCVTCLTYAERRAARLAASDTPTDQGETMAAEKNDINTPEGAAALEQIEANIERAASLAEAENAEALAELENETEALIVSLSGKDSIKAKKKARDDWRAAATAQEKPKAKAKGKAVAPKEEAPPVKTYDQYEGVPELINMGAEKAVEGIKLSQKASETARELSEIILDMWLRIPNSNKKPDLMGTSDEARKGAAALYTKVAEALGASGMAAHHADREVKRIIRSVQSQRSNARAAFLRSIDENKENRAVFQDVLADKPDDVLASRWVAAHYETSLIGQGEREALLYYVKNNTVASVPPNLEALLKIEPGIITELQQRAQPALEGTPDEKLTAVVNMLEGEFKKVTKAVKPEEIESASDQVKTAQRTRLEAMYEEIKKLIAATL